VIRKCGSVLNLGSQKDAAITVVTAVGRSGERMQSERVQRGPSSLRLYRAGSRYGLRECGVKDAVCQLIPLGLVALACISYLSAGISGLLILANGKVSQAGTAEYLSILAWPRDGYQKNDVGAEVQGEQMEGRISW